MAHVAGPALRRSRAGQGDPPARTMSVAKRCLAGDGREVRHEGADRNGRRASQGQVQRTPRGASADCRPYRCDTQRSYEYARTAVSVGRGLDVAEDPPFLAPC